MMKSVRDIEWDDFTEALPAFLMLVMMPLTFSITDGIAFGFISYALLKLVTGRAKEVHWLIYVFALLFVVRYAIGGLALRSDSATERPSHLTCQLGTFNITAVRCGLRIEAGVTQW